MNPAIKTTGLSKSYGDVVALDSVNLEIDGPSIIGLLGKNGSGKTTLIRQIMGEHLPTGGNVETLGVPASGLGQNELSTMGYVPQEIRLLDWMTVAFHANIDNAATVNLYEPGATSPIAITPPGVTYRADEKHSVYRIRTPMPGLWIYTVQPKVASAEFFAVASAPTSLSARVGPRQLAARPGGDYSMPLRVWVADENAVLSATVEGYVRRPDAVKDTITLHDDGTSMDGAPNDAIYGLEYIASIPGAHYVDLKVSGSASNSEPFERYLSTAFYVPGQDKRPDQVGEGGTPRTPEGLCDGPVWCCWLWLVFVITVTAAVLMFLRALCSTRESTHAASNRSRATPLIILLIAIVLGWLLLTYCTIALCWFLLSISLALIVAGLLACFTQLVPCMGMKLSP